jgi:hypothetical protein
MRRLRLLLVPVLLLAGALPAGCGGSSPSNRAVGATEVPLPAGARVAARARTCDRGANPYCTVQLVVAGPSYPDAFALLVSERARLRHLGWSMEQGDTGKEIAAESPGNELRLTYATAYNDLLAIDSGWIKRSAPVGHALAHVLFARVPAISLLLQRGSS